MDQGGDQLLSFLLYSLFVYPLTNYILSPQRNLPRWKAILFATSFLVLVTYIQLVSNSPCNSYSLTCFDSDSFVQQYQSQSDGLNYYQIMQIDRSTPIAQIKKIYRTLSRNLHPDKNKSETAADEFRIVAHAFDVLTDKEKRREYDRLGETGVNALAHGVIDHKYILSHMIVHYLSSLVFAFLLNLSEKGEAFNIACAALAAIFLLELCLKIHEWPLPAWFFPQHTPHQIIGVLHQIYSPFMHGVRCILAVVQVNAKSSRENALEGVHATTSGLTIKVESIFFRSCTLLENQWAQESSIADVAEAEPAVKDVGQNDEDHATAGEHTFVSPLSVPTMSESLEEMLSFASRMVNKNKAKEGKVIDDVQNRLKASLNGRRPSKDDGSWLILIRNLAIFIGARYLFVKGE